MQKFLIICSLGLILSACGFRSDSDFVSLYKKHVHAEVTTLEDTAKSLGLYRQEHISGMTDVSVRVPMMLSGMISFAYDTKLNGRDADVVLNHAKVAYDSLMGSGGLSIDKIGLISKSGDMYFFFDGLMDTLLPDAARDVLKKYEKTWLSWTKEDVKAALSGATQEEIMANTVVENISKMTLDDIAEYLIKYPIFLEKTNLGMQENLHVFSIDIDREAIINLAVAITRDLTGSGMEDAQRNAISQKLQGLTFSGTLGFDPKDPKTAELKLLVSESGSKEIGIMNFSIHDTHTHFSISSSATQSSIELDLAKEPEKNTLQLSISESGSVIGKLVGYVQREGDVFREFGLDITAQGLTVSMKHILKADGSIEGSIQLPIVGSIVWNGKYMDKKLTALTLKGNTPSGSVFMDLAPQGDRIMGPLTIKQGSEMLLSSMISLLIDQGKFGLGIDILPTENTTKNSDPQARVSINVTHMKKEFHDSISIPAGIKPLKDLINELDVLMPKEQFIPVENAGTDLEVQSTR